MLAHHLFIGSHGTNIAGHFSMKPHIVRSYVEQMIKTFPRLESLLDQLRFGTRAEISKNLTRLVAKLCQHKKMTSEIEVFKRCSIFRGMDCINA
jgi:hypothetical protein